MMTLKNTHAMEQAKALADIIEKLKVLLNTVLKTGELIPCTMALTMDDLDDNSKIVSGSICFAPTSMIIHHISNQMEAMPEGLRSAVMMSLVVDHMGELLKEECDDPDCGCRNDTSNMVPGTDEVH
jgi:hypothetical protein